MKNHYKIHQEHCEDFDDEEGEEQPSTKLALKATTADGSMMMSTEKPTPVLKTEMLDWLRSDFDQVDLGASSSSTKLASERVTQSMSNLNVQEKSLKEDQDEDWVHLD